MLNVLSIIKTIGNEVIIMNKDVIKKMKRIVIFVIVFVMLSSINVSAAWNSPKLDVETEAQICEDYLEFYKLENSNSSYVQKMTVDEILILGYFGNHGGYEIVEMWFTEIPCPSLNTDMEIGGYTFSLNVERMDNYFFAYKDSEFVLVSDAYALGLLSDDDMRGIAEACGVIDLWECPFADVDKEDWYYEYVKFAYSTSLFSGLKEDIFGPDEEMTRAMLTTVLWRYAGSPTGFENVFKDVPNGVWYTEAVSWAAANKIVYGLSEDTFAPDETVTREQITTILHRYAELLKNEELEPEFELKGFDDLDDISDWAYESMNWAQTQGLIYGREIDKRPYLVPRETATRAEVAALLMRFVEYIN